MKLAYFAISKASWLTPEIDAIARRSYESLKTLDAEILYDGITSTEDEAIARSEKYAGERPDAVILHLVTFPVGATLPAIAERFDVPFIVIANPEAPGADGMWNQNSFCGANMAAHGLNRLRKRHTFVMAPAEELAEAVAVPVAALRGIAAAKSCRVGLFGGRVPGFYTSNFDELGLRRELGTTVEVIELLEVINTAEHLTDSELADGRATVKKSASGSIGLDGEALEKAAKLFAAFRKVCVKYHLDATAVRCWPELSDYFGIAPCAILGMLTDAGFPAACEGDVTGAVTMRVLQAVSQAKSAPFFVDWISFDKNDNTGVFWHCGAAAPSLCRDFSATRLRMHMRVDGGDKKGITNDFAMKSGEVTIAKIDTDADGKWRMLILPATGLETEAFLRGNPLRVKFHASLDAVIKTVFKKGFEHHYSAIHADAAAALELFCEWTNLENVAVR